MSSLLIYTAFASYRGPDKFDISRKSGDAVFAPSWKLLTPFLDLRKGAGLTDPAWEKYAADYTDEMRTSFMKHRKEWKALLARQSVTLTCYCKLPAQCHRTVLGGILAKLGADFRGEHQPVLL